MCLVGKAREHLVLTSPYVTEPPLREIAERLLSRRHDPPSVHVITDLSAINIIEASVDASALCRFVEACPGTVITHCPGVHAKVYLADTTEAIVTSGNLTSRGLRCNYEYGLVITESKLIAAIKQEVGAYAALGAPVPLRRLGQIAAAAQRTRQARDAALGSARRELQRAFERELARTQIEVLRSRAEGRTTQSILCDTLLYLLAKGAASTEQLHLHIQAIHPDICDDSVDRIIGGVHFGKKWKHYVRSAQQALKHRGLVQLVDGLWRLP
jgi:hypothetical protein